ncbi:glycosyltransferase [Nocardioides sp. SOB77]|uniref:Glycosyltransferase n=1 Tax=Nocardioides oceani TaxID=3058369 RepID=A0ABT8FLS9_9ACTN|nr:glycosyltransferase [Nocardioides oceani]MDN4175466.1 glycosyltransferase [Nocardioides oceani]
MKIALVSEHADPLATLGGVDAGGQNVHVAALAAGLARRGHEVVVHTRRDRTGTPDRVRTADGYVVDHVPAGPPTEVPKDDLLPHMPAFAERLAAQWRRWRPDVVHAHFWMSGVASLDATAGTGVPVVQTFHALGSVKRRWQGADDTSPADRIDLERRICREAARVVATCSDEVRELVELGLDPARADVIPCGVDVGHFRPGAAPAGVPTGAGRAGRRRVLVIGRMVARKGIDDAVRAVARIPDVELVVAGGPLADALDADPEVARLRALAADLGVSDRVVFTGAVPRGDVPALVRSSDVVVTVPWYEPFGIVPLEAMACGRPVVGSAVGGLLDTVVPGVTGELVPPRDPDALAGALGALLADDVRRAAYGRAGRRRALERYDWRCVVEQTESVYAALLGAPARLTSEVTR